MLFAMFRPINITSRSIRITWDNFKNTLCLINSTNAWPLIGHAKYGAMAPHVVRASLLGLIQGRNIKKLHFKPDLAHLDVGFEMNVPSILWQNLVDLSYGPIYA
jgi:hypothetical protein